MAAGRSKAERAQAPLRVGVTGHRFLADEDQIAARVDCVLLRIRQAFEPQTLSVISGLAAGADQLVARRALVLPDTRLVVSLPMLLSEYVEDFETPTARRQFFELFSRAAEIVTLPPAATRDDAYLAGGVHVVEGSDVLIAIWDGQPARGRGGTAEIVALARARGLPLAWIPAVNQARDAVAGTGVGKGEAWITFERFPASAGTDPFRA